MHLIAWAIAVWPELNCEQPVATQMNHRCPFGPLLASACPDEMSCAHQRLALSVQVSAGLLLTGVGLHAHPGPQA